MPVSSTELLRYLTNKNFPTNLHIKADFRQVKRPCELHWHEFFEIEIVLSGSAVGSINGKEYIFKRGSVSVLSPTDFHCFDNIQNPLELINISFDDSIITASEYYPFFYANKLNYFVLGEEGLQQIRQLAARIVFESGGSRILKDRYIINTFECLLIEMIRQIAPNSEPNVIGKPVLAALNVLHSSFREDPDLKEIAQISGYSLNYFCNAFKKATGKTYKEYLNGLKLDYAKKLLLSADVSVTEVCFASGFNSLSHFLREFKKYHGMSPLQLKRRYL